MCHYVTSCIELLIMSQGAAKKAASILCISWNVILFLDQASELGVFKVSPVCELLMEADYTIARWSLAQNDYYCRWSAICNGHHYYCRRNLNNEIAHITANNKWRVISLEMGSQLANQRTVRLSSSTFLLKNIMIASGNIIMSQEQHHIWYRSFTLGAEESTFSFLELGSRWSEHKKYLPLRLAAYQTTNISIKSQHQPKILTNTHDKIHLT